MAKNSDKSTRWQKANEGFKKYRKVKAVISIIFIVLTVVMVIGFVWGIIEGLPLIGKGLGDAIKDGLS